MLSIQTTIAEIFFIKLLNISLDLWNKPIKSIFKADNLTWQLLPDLNRDDSENFKILLNM